MAIPLRPLTWFEAMRTPIFQPRQTVVVTGHDILSALAHLRSMPMRAPTPAAWNRQHVINLIRDAMPENPKVNDCFCFGPGLYGIIKPFGVDLAGMADDPRLQVWVAIRTASTSLKQVTEL